MQISDAEFWAQIEDAGPLPPDAWTEGEQAPSGDGDTSERLLAQTDRRRTFIAFYAWAVPTREAIAAIAAFAGERTILEICAGYGLWARLLLATGAAVVATDGVAPRTPGYVTLETIDASDAVRSHRECAALFVCWPPFGDACATRALDAFTGDRLIFAGDPRFTADAAFHARLVSTWSPRHEILLPSWPGLDDRVYLYERSA